LNETRQLAEFASALRLEDIPPAVLERAKLLLLDHFGVSLFATRTAWGRIATDYAARFSGLPESTIYGHPTKVHAEFAALANGTFGHGYELDDSHEGGWCHPGAPVIPVAFNLAEAHQRGGSDMLLSMVVGYEFMGRIGNALGAEGIKRHHPTGQIGVFAAAAAASKVAGADLNSMLNALGIAGSMASGLLQFADDPEGTMVKRLHGGWPAHSGVVASRLASRGLTGPAGVLEGRLGFLRSITDHFDLSPLTSDLGGTWEVMRTAVKLYPTCRLLHPMIEAVERMKNKHSISARNVKAVEVVSPTKGVDQQMIYEPKSLMAAQYSLPFAVAWAFCEDSSDLKALNEPTLTDSAILSLARRVTASANVDFDKAYPRYATRMKVRTMDDREITEEVWDAKGSSMKPASADDMTRKFQNMARGLIANPNKLMDEVLSIESKKSLDALSAALRETPR